MLEREYQYYKNNEESFVQKYNGKFIGIVQEEVVGVFDSDLEAYTTLKERYGLGKFLVQHAVPTKDERIQRYHSRVAFR